VTSWPKLSPCGLWRPGYEVILHEKDIDIFPNMNVTGFLQGFHFLLGPLDVAFT